jgi:hypothetical protein
MSVILLHFRGHLWADASSFVEENLECPLQPSPRNPPLGAERCGGRGVGGDLDAPAPIFAYQGRLLSGVSPSHHHHQGTTKPWPAKAPVYG